MRALAPAPDPQPFHEPFLGSGAVFFGLWAGGRLAGARVSLSNSSAASIERLYGGRSAVAAGFRMRRVPARRAINNRADRRGPVDELVVSNRLPAVQGLSP